MDHVRSLTYCFALLSLMNGDKYGLELQDYVSTHYQVEISPGALYPMLQSLGQQGYIEPISNHALSEKASEMRRGKPRKYYRITESGVEYVRCLRQCFASDDDDLGDPPNTTDPQFGI